MIREIEFKQTSNVFLNSGIIGLYIYLQKHKRDNSVNYQFNFKLEKDYLRITCDNDSLLTLLEDVYYKMGKDYYDTSTKEQKKENGNAYFDEKENTFKRFPKMNTLGLTQLITNNAQGTTILKENTIKKVELSKKNPELLKRYEYFFKTNNLELLSKLYLNEPYTKITRLDIAEKYLYSGEKKCSLTGESFKELVDYTCSSPLLAGINNFESFGKYKSRQISWKASYLSRFSPVTSFYFYITRLKDEKKLTCYFFQSDNLKNNYRLYDKYKHLFLDKNELVENSYMSNFKLLKFDNQKKDSVTIEKNTEFLWQSEILFMLLYTYYKNFFFEKTIEENDDSDIDDEIEQVRSYDEVPISLIYFRADSFASTMRPYLFEQFNHYKFIISLFVYLEKQGINSQEMWSLLISLKYIKVSDRKSTNKYGIERKLRNEILNNILHMKSILNNIETLFYYCFNDLISNEYKGYRNFYLVFDVLCIYEKIILFGGVKNMTEELQEKAVKLGSSIGMGIINYNSPQKKTDKEINVIGGRKYIISLNKSRTLQQFLNEIIRIETRYGMIVNEDLLKSINDDNWEYIKSFCIISALNKLNIELLPKKEDKGDN